MSTPKRAQPVADDEAFWVLISHDEALLRLEFDKLIGASWPDHASNPPACV